jgi:hypothetical protein
MIGCWLELLASPLSLGIPVGGVYFSYIMIHIIIDTAYVWKSAKLSNVRSGC